MEREIESSSRSYARNNSNINNNHHYSNLHSRTAARMGSLWSPTYSSASQTESLDDINTTAAAIVVGA